VIVKNLGLEISAKSLKEAAMKMGDDPADTAPTPHDDDHSDGRPRGTKSAKKTAPKTRRFEVALREIESIVGRLEGGELDLDDSLEQYQKGIETLKECHLLLKNAERKITLLSGFDAEGNPIEVPFDESEMTLDEKQASRGTRRTASRKPPGTAEGLGDEDEISGRGLF
jgi:exodeoxyribonuclease VII small subunit